MAFKRCLLVDCGLSAFENVELVSWTDDLEIISVVGRIIDVFGAREAVLFCGNDAVTLVEDAEEDALIEDETGSSEN